METMIEEIRKRIKARMDNTDAAGDYDEYADGQGVGLAAALRIIDEVEKEHPAPSDAEEAATEFANQDCVTFISRKKGFIAGTQYERERLMKEAVEAELWRHNGRTLKVSAVLPANSPIKLGDKVSVIIIKKEK